jgi:hypothetical protein
LDEYTPPLQVNVYTELPAAVGVTVAEPLAVCAPVQAPLAVHAVPLLEDQVTVALWPAVMVVGLTAMVMAAADMPPPLPPYPPPPQALNINAQKIPITPPMAARVLCMLNPPMRVVVTSSKCPRNTERFNL